MKFLYRICLYLVIVVLVNTCSIPNYNNQNINNHKLSYLKLKIGYEYLQAKDLPQAKKYFLQAFSLQPKDPNNNLALAYYFTLVGFENQADFYFRKSIFYAKHKGLYWNNYGVYLCTHKQLLEGEKYLLWAAKDVNYINNVIAYKNAALCRKKHNI